MPQRSPAQEHAHVSCCAHSVHPVRLVCLVLLVCFVLLTQTACTLLGKGTSHPVASPAPSQQLPTNIDLQSVAMLSANEGWAVGNTTPPPNYPHSNQPMPTSGGRYMDPVIAHFLRG